MFESAELGHRIDKASYAHEVETLRADLLDAQYDLLAAGVPVIILVNGIDGAGKSETVNLLNSWMDPRHIATHAFAESSDEERERPPMWRFWRALPAKGRIAIFFGNWYTAPIVGRVDGTVKSAELERRIEEIKRFERMLGDEGVLLLKFWFHLSWAAQEERLKKLGKDPKTRWRVTDTDRWRFRHYDRYRAVSERVLRETDSGHAPWSVIDGSDARYRALAVGRQLLAALRQRLARPAGTTRRVAGPRPAPALDGRDVINALDLSLALAKGRYDTELEKWQGRLNLLSRRAQFRRRSVVVVFEGNDAAGKGGAVRRITGALDARQYHVIPVAAPSDEELARPYLWRFWRQVPRQGRVAVFDRSWYGRVLVERVEGFCAEADWMRAYSEINEFEEQLDRHGAIVVKFWLAISADEQLRRFKEREQTRFKRFKIGAEDWRNRDKSDQYEAAVCDMVDRTSTAIAPWTLVEGNDKNYARVKILRTLCERLEAGLSAGRKPGAD